MLKGAAGLAALALLTGCDSASLPGSSIDGTYVGGNDMEAYIMRLASNPDGSLTGDMGVAQVNYRDGKLDLNSRAISGRVAENQLFLTVHGSAYGAADVPLTGDVSGSDLQLRAPGGTVAVTLSKGDQRDYEKQVQVLARNLTANDVGLLPEG